jgi:ketosteroid isomerase-like protein
MDTTSTGAQLQQDDTAQIRATIAPWVQACVDRDWDGLLAMCTEDVVFSGPGQPNATGDALRPWLEDYPVMKAFTFDFDRVEVSGDLAVASGSGNDILELEGQEVAGNFEFTDVFRKDQSGTWLYSWVTFNRNE